MPRPGRNYTEWPFSSDTQDSFVEDKLAERNFLGIRRLAKKKRPKHRARSKERTYAGFEWNPRTASTRFVGRNGWKFHRGKSTGKILRPKSWNDSLFSRACARVSELPSLSRRNEDNPLGTCVNGPAARDQSARVKLPASRKTREKRWSQRANSLPNRVETQTRGPEHGDAFERVNATFQRPLL